MRDDREVLRNAVAGFVAANPQLATSKGCHDHAKGVAESLVRHLREHGLDAKLVGLSGWKRSHTLDAYAAWRDIPRADWHHRAVMVGNVVVDCCARQFDSKDEFPVIEMLNRFRDRWVMAVLPERSQPGEPLVPAATRFHPEIHFEHGLTFYDDGFVHGVVDSFEMEDGAKGLVIHEWSSHYPGKGYSARALEWLRQEHATIIANGVGTIDLVDGELVGDIATQYWQHMRSKGLVDALIDDDGVEIDAENRQVVVPAGP